MRVVPASSIAYRPAGSARSLQQWWQQAGFSSFAYRLAHLRVRRGLLTPLAAVLFYLA
jgi:hypothetical protein